ncbi:MAG TPA: DUF928 domain-containing protein [Xenococcaceae cyanobacterium]
MYLTLGIICPVLAEYKKPSSTSNDAPRSGSTGVTATRGICPNSQDSFEQKANSGSLTALAPYAHVGRSASTNPTLTWYVPDPEPYPIKFTLYELDLTDNSQNKATKIYEVELKNPSGIMTHSLPTEQVNLIPERDYMWQVTVICNRARPSENIMVGSQIKIVEADPNIATQISAISESDLQSSSEADRVAKADIYAKAGFWYDAIAEVATAKGDPQADDYTVKLISQLAAMEDRDSDSSDVKNTNSHSENLKQIIAVLTTVNE